MNNSTLDDAKLSSFHIKTSVAGTAGQFCDGYIIGIIAPALPLLQIAHSMTPLMSGLLGASVLAGLFCGAPLFGRLTDKIGRRIPFIFSLSAIVLLSLLQMFAANETQLLIIRFLIGIVVGADYAIAPTLVAEFSPKKHRAILLAVGPAMWTVGYVVAFVIGLSLSSLGDDAWRYMLGSGAVPALLVLILRLQTPESPRWLAQNGRTQEALAIIRKNINPLATLQDVSEEIGAKHTLSETSVFAPEHRKRLAFVCLFWFCQVVPYFAVFTFLPSVIQKLAVSNGLAETLVVNLFLLLGSVLGVILISKLGRRPYTILSFSILTLTTGAIGIWEHAPVFYVMVCFGLFALISSAMSSLDVVYPSELFPTDIRATATGISVSFSRIGAAIGTFLLPIGMNAYGVHAVTFAAAVIAGIGLIVSVAWAPETRHLSLAAASNEDPSVTR